MLPISHPPRALLLVLCLSACAAADPGASTQATAGHDVSGAVLVGRQALASDDTAVAAAAFDRALAADPTDTDLQQQAFAAALLAGRPDAPALARQLPGDPAALLVLADADIAAGNWSAAAAKFAQLPPTGPNQLLQPLLLAWAQQGQGATDQALATLQPYLERNRFRGLFALHAAMINDLAGRPTQAARLYRLALLDYGSLNLRLGSIVAGWQARTGQEAEARGTVRAMAQTSPELAIAEPALQQGITGSRVETATDGVAESYLALAAALQQQDAPSFALLLLHLAVGLRPDFTAARLLLAETLATHGQMDGAVAALAPVPPSDPLAAVVQLRLAGYAERQGHVTEAQRILLQLASTNPGRPEPLAALGEVQAEQGHFAEAADTYGRAIARLGQPGPADWALFYQRGVAYDRAHDWPHAEADLLHALDLAPDQPLVLNYLGYAWTEQHRNLPRARQMIGRAVELRPNDGSLVDSLGWVLLQSGDKAGAIQYLERATELQPEDATINAHLGDAYHAAGRQREAQVQWRRALILHPDAQDAARLQAKLSGSTRPTLPLAAERRLE